jgi:sulfonate transport system permease protein
MTLTVEAPVAQANPAVDGGGTSRRPWGRYAIRGAGTLVVVAGLLAIWQVLANNNVFGAGTFPGPWGIWKQLIADRSLYVDNVETTLGEALPGLLVGAVPAFILGAIFVESAFAERLLNASTIGLLCAPPIALAPVFYVVFNPYTEKMLIAALSAFFPVLVATIAGFRSTDPMMADVVRAYGGGRYAVARRVKLRNALPVVASGVQIAFPAAVLGAILGEFAGGTSGIGVFMMNSLAQFNPDRTWGAGAVATLLGTTGFLLLGVAQRYMARGQALALRSANVSDDLASVSVRRPIRIGLWAASIVIAVGGWWLFLIVFHVNSYFGRTPADVFKFLFSDDGASGADRSDIWHALGQTLPSAVIGAALGLIAAYLAAVIFLWSKSMEKLLMTFAMVLQAVPLQAMTPLIVVTLGRGMVSSVGVAVLVTFFPSVVLMASGMRDVPASAADLFRVFHASEPVTVLKLRTPTALPRIFAAARLGLPGALMGVLVAEYLATGQGIGFILSNSAAMSKYSKLWTATVIITLVSVVMYTAVGRAERRIERIYGGGR